MRLHKDAMLASWGGFRRTMSSGGWIALLIVLMVDPIAAALTNDAPRLTIRELKYENGFFHQLVVPEQAPVLMAQWTGSITSEDHMFVCGGGGIAPYGQKIDPLKMTPTQWTGDDCPPLSEGGRYNATASWEWKSPDGSIERMSASIEFIASGIFEQGAPS